MINIRDFFKNFFNKKDNSTKTTENPMSHLKIHEEKLIESIINELKTNPNNFSAKWFDGKTLDTSVRSENGKILISIETGQILQPIKINMNKKQISIIKELIKPIVEKDSIYVIQNLFD